VALLIVPLLPMANDSGATHAAPAQPAASAVVSAAPVAAANGASFRVENGVVKFYFESGKAELATGAESALADVARGVAGGKRAVISGYTDATGDPAKNEELAKARALAVSNALGTAGVAADKIDLRKPETLTGSGNDSEARRVEVSLS